MQLVNMVLSYTWNQAIPCVHSIIIIMAEMAVFYVAQMRETQMVCNFIEYFESLDVMSNMDTSENLTDWMKDFTCGLQGHHDDQGQTQSPDLIPELRGFQ